MKERACKNCRLMTTVDSCPRCGSTSLSADWSGYVVIRDPENSTIAKRLGITSPGKYALKVK